MSNSDEEPVPPDALPESLVRRIDSLQEPTLRTLLSYVERRIEAVDTPVEEEIEATAAGEVPDTGIAEEIEATADGEVLQIENHGTYALVRKHPPDPDGSGVDTDIVSLYHVRREPHPDGTESLHWAYLGDVGNAEPIRCDSCGGHLDMNASTCPHCGSENTHQSETDE